MHLADDVWAQVQASLPIACVDLVVTDGAAQVLLVLRRNFPAQWWLPGGRVLHREPRATAARRKLAEECGLAATSIEDWGTHDLIFDAAPPGGAAHAITTLYRARVAGSAAVTLDAQSAAAEWRPARAWLDTIDHPLLVHALERVAREG